MYVHKRTSRCQDSRTLRLVLIRRHKQDEKQSFGYAYAMSAYASHRMSCADHLLRAGNGHPEAFLSRRVIRCGH